MEAITKNIRDKISKQVTTQHYLDPQILQKLDDDTDNCILVILIDYYNGLLYKEVTSELSSKDISFLRSLSSKSLDELVGLVKLDPYYIKEAIDNQLFFEDLSNLRQQDMMRFIRMSKGDNAITRSNLYRSDMVEYMPANSLKGIVNDYKNHISMYGRNMQVHADAINNILVNLDELKMLDIDNYKKIMSDVIPEFYKYNQSPSLDYKRKVRTPLYLFLIKNLSKDNIIKLCCSDKSFEAELINLYLYVQNLSPDVLKSIDEFGAKKLSKTIKRKYNIKEN